MLQLVIKDFRANWSYVLLGLAVLLTLSMTFIYTALREPFAVDPDVLIYFLIVIVSSIVFSLLFLMIEQLYNTNILYASVPVSRKQFVQQRYVATYFQLILALGVHFLGLQIGIYFYGSMDPLVLEALYNPLTWLLILIVLVILNGFSMPFYFKFGVRKGILIIGLIQCFSLIAFVYIMMYFSEFWDAFQNMIFNVIALNTLTTIPICIGLSLLLTWISIQTSVSIYKSKDL
ncbi:MAG: hypothetical protein COB60_11590 [Flavobacteriaceae bacterium]|nr:MAG: hypothetical protein COB60_11590 [Flavobacteriaceae bacterium]